MSQLSHTETSFPAKKLPLVLILDNVTGPANIGSIFRLADAFNISALVLCGNEIDLTSNRLLRTARATIPKVHHIEKEDTLEACKEYSNNGFSLFALEITSDSRPLDSFNFGKHHKIALVVGNENSGITEDVLDLVQQKIHITMFGKNSSMNVAQATGIALYEISKSLQDYH